MLISLACSPRFWSIITFSLLLWACDGGAPKFKSTDITGADYGKALELADTSGRVRHLEDFRGKAVLVFFGFTQCPDVCPTTLADLAGVMKTLGAVFVAYALRIYLAYSDAVAQQTFRYSIAYLASLFAALLVDHYL